MKTSYVATLVLSLATLASTQVMAMSSAHLTRDQVRAELADAIRTGDVTGFDEQGRKLNELFPGRYPSKVAAQGKTRAQVQAELAEAMRTGDILGWDEQGRKLNELYPDRYPGKSVAVVSDESAQTAANDASSYDPLQNNGVNFFDGH